MALDNIWKLHSIVIVPNAAADLDVGNTYIGALDNVSFPVNATVQRQVPSGKIFATTGRIDFTTADLTFTSTMAKVMIDALSVKGTCLAPGGDKIHLYVAKFDCDGPASGEVHMQYEVTKGILHPTSMNCEHKGDLTVSATMKAVYDGTNDPVTVVEGVPLPGDNLFTDIDGRWTLHDETKTTVNAVATGNKSSVNVDFGITTETFGADSSPYDQFAGVSTALPVVTLTSLDPTWFDGLGLSINGKLVTHANTKIPFRKRDGAGGFETDVTAVHIEMTAHGPAHYTNLLNASGTSPAGTTVQISPIDDGAGNDPLEFDTLAAL